jgi:hypothetical protein
MDGETFDRWARGLGTRLGRRGLGRVIAAGVAVLGLGTAAEAKRKKKKKKAKMPAAGCASPNVACGAACCPPDEPCIDGRCGCGAGTVFCSVDGTSGCVPGNCCPTGACAGQTCCPADTTCLFADGGVFACRCITRLDDCAGRCCPTGQACYGGTCDACRPGPGNPRCGPLCLCVTSVENAAACVDGTTVLDCHDCADDATCTALLERPALCIARAATESCPTGRTCVAATCPDS